MTVDGKRCKAQSGDIRKRTPLEQAIAEQNDRRVRYEVRRRAEGFTRTTMLVREEHVPGFKVLLKLANGSEADQEAFRRLVAQARVDA